MTVKRLAAVAITAVVLASTLAIGGMGQVGVGNQELSDPQETTYLRVVHASPDAPAVDVAVENETVLEDVPFGNVSDYLELSAGTHNVTITVADDPNATVFEGNLTLEPRAATTLAAAGEVSEDAETPFELIAIDDDAATPDENHSALRFVHLSPDAPAVDVTAENGSVVLAENVSYGNASDYVTVPAGNYTAEIRGATPGNNGTVVTTVDVSLANGTAHSALAIGYLNASAAPAETPFEVVTTEDASFAIRLPGEEPPDEGNATETETETMTETETETITETATEMEPGTETPTEPETETEMDTATGTET